MAVRTILTRPVGERTTAWLRATITGQDGVTALPDAATVLRTLTLLLYDKVTGRLITATPRNILSLNGGTVYSALQTLTTTDATGKTTTTRYNLLVELAPADNVIVGAGETEQHIALIAWDWGSGKDGKHEIQFPVANLAKVG